MFFNPSAAASTIRERCANAWALFGRRAHDSKLLALFIAQNDFNRYRTWHPPSLNQLRTN